jgi:hypothetical protein
MGAGRQKAHLQRGRHGAARAAVQFLGKVVGAHHETRHAGAAAMRAAFRMPSGVSIIAQIVVSAVWAAHRAVCQCLDIVRVVDLGQQDRLGPDGGDGVEIVGAPGVSNPLMRTIWAFAP